MKSPNTVGRGDAWSRQALTIGQLHRTPFQELLQFAAFSAATNSVLTINIWSFNTHTAAL